MLPGAGDTVVAQMRGLLPAPCHCSGEGARCSACGSPSNQKHQRLPSTTCTPRIFHEPEFFILIYNECDVQVEESG